MNDSQKMKTKFRASKIWKNFKHQMYTLQNGIDPITKKKLYKGANLHHLDLQIDNYQNLSNTDHFMYVNKSTHSWIHEIYRIYVKDPEVISRLDSCLKKMVEINVRS